MSRSSLISTRWASVSTTAAGTAANISWAFGTRTDDTRTGAIPRRIVGSPWPGVSLFRASETSVEKAAEQAHTLGIGLRQLDASCLAFVEREMFTTITKHHPMSLARNHLQQAHGRAGPGIGACRIAIAHHVHAVRREGQHHLAAVGLLFWWLWLLLVLGFLSLSGVCLV